jgi:hypothetical protein
MKVLDIPKSGKCGNPVWQHNRYGRICYPAFVPANPRTPAEVAVRGRFGAGREGSYRATLFPGVSTCGSRSTAATYSGLRLGRPPAWLRLQYPSLHSVRWEA